MRTPTARRAAEAGSGAESEVTNWGWSKDAVRVPQASAALVL
jgi:hypothetical protein